MSFHEDLRREHAKEGSSDRAFGFVFTAVFMIIGGVQLWHGVSWAPAWFAVAAIILLISLARPAILGPANRLWMRFGLLLHKVVSPVVLGVLFFVAVTPTGLLMRVFGKDPLRLRRDPAAASYWIVRDDPGPAPETMKNQF